MRVRVIRTFRYARTGEVCRRGDELDVPTQVGRGLIAMRYAEAVGNALPEEPDGRTKPEPSGEAEPREAVVPLEANSMNELGGKRGRKK